MVSSRQLCHDETCPRLAAPDQVSILGAGVGTQVNNAGRLSVTQQALM